jgi:hypothetical protein
MRNVVDVASFGGEIEVSVDGAQGHRKRDEDDDDVDERNSSLRT